MVIGTALANEYIVQGLFSRAEQQALKLVELYPDFPGAHHELLDHYLWHTGEFAKALGHARALERIDPGNFDALRHQAEIHIAVGDFQAAAAVQERIIDLNPNHYWAGWADFLKARAEGNAPAVRESGNWILQRAGEEKNLFRIVANALLAAGETSKAREIYLQTDPGWLIPDEWGPLMRAVPGDSCIMSWVLIHTGDPDLGQALLEQTTRYLEHDLPAVIEHADRYTPDICYLTSGDAEKALASIAAQLAHGHIFYFSNHHLPMYELINQDPRYLGLLEERDRRVAEQRDAIAKMEL